MKTAVQPAPIQQKTIITRTLSADPDPNARTTPEFWSYIEALKPEEWDRHLVYIYRTDPRASNYGDGQSAIDKCSGFMDMPDGTQIPFNDREEIEMAIQRKHGGKAFRLILKRGHERLTEGKSSNDAPPRYANQPSYASSNPTVSASPLNEASATADVAKQAITTMAGQERQATEVAISALRGAADVVTRLASAPATPQNDIMTQFMAAMIQKMLAPPPDPFEQFAKFMTLMTTMRQGGDLNPAGMPAGLNRIMDLALERFVNPVSAAPPINASAELVRTLPSVAGHVTEAIQAWARGTEAQRDTAAIMAQGGQPPHPTAQPQKVLPGANPAQPRPIAPAPANNPATPGGSTVAAAPSLEFVETKIMEILQENISAEDAADDCLAFLDRMDQKLVAQLVSAGENGLMQLFNMRPILRPATVNQQRLTEFIRAFLRFANESMMKPEGQNAIPVTPVTPGNA